MELPVLQDDCESPIKHEQTNSDKEALQLLDLPLELQLLITQQLPYPDSLAMKLTSTHFRDLITPTHTVAKRVTWLLERANIALHIPTMGKLKLNTDESFLRSPEVQTILRERRTHQECVVVWETQRRVASKDHGNVVRGCLVQMNGEVCESIKQKMEEIDKAREERACRGRRRWYQLDLKQFELARWVLYLRVVVIALLLASGHLTEQWSLADLSFQVTIRSIVLMACSSVVIMLAKLMAPRLVLVERRLRSQWRAGNTWYMVEYP